jgi:hypothetical protein
MRISTAPLIPALHRVRDGVTIGTAEYVIRISYQLCMYPNLKRRFSIQLAYFQELSYFSFLLYGETEAVSTQFSCFLILSRRGTSLISPLILCRIGLNIEARNDALWGRSPGASTNGLPSIVLHSTFSYLLSRELELRALP